MRRKSANLAQPWGVVTGFHSSADMRRCIQPCSSSSLSTVHLNSAGSSARMSPQGSPRLKLHGRAQPVLQQQQLPHQVHALLVQLQPCKYLHCTSEIGMGQAMSSLSSLQQQQRLHQVPCSAGAAAAMHAIHGPIVRHRYAAGMMVSLISQSSTTCHGLKLNGCSAW